MRLGSIMINFTASGSALNSMLSTMALRATLFPVPVAPAMSRWGILAKSAVLGAALYIFAQTQGETGWRLAKYGGGKPFP